MMPLNLIAWIEQIADECAEVYRSRQQAARLATLALLLAWAPIERWALLAFGVLAVYAFLQWAMDPGPRFKSGLRKDRRRR
jgi:hypothetical protein